MQPVNSEFPDRLAVLHKCRYFDTLPDAILEELAQSMRLEHFERGAAIFWHDDPCPGLCILERGIVKLFKVSPNGRELIINLVSEGETFNEVPVFDQGPNPVGAAALDDADLWIIPGESIRQAMAAHPEMNAAIVLALSQNLRKLVGIIEELSFYQVTHRLARLISSLPNEQLSGEGGLRITQDQMAARLGTVREVVARSLRELQRSGAIRMERRQIKIADEQILAEWGQGP